MRLVLSWFEQKARPNPQHKFHVIFAINQDSNLNEYKAYLNGFLRLDSWDFASMLGLPNMSGIWDLLPRVDLPSTS